MSTCAYRVERREIDDRVWISSFPTPTFSFGYDDAVRIFLTIRATCDQLNENSGRFTIHVNSLKELLSEIEKGNVEASNEVILRLEKDLKETELLNTLSIEYEVY